MVKLTIDQDVCQGHGRCYGMAPELIGSDEQGYPVVPEGGLEIADDDLAAEIEGGCPEMAIALQA